MSTGASLNRNASEIRTADEHQNAKNAWRARSASDEVRPRSCRQLSHGSTTTAAMLTAAHTAARASRGVSEPPETAPFPSTATDRTQSLALWTVLAPATIFVGCRPGSGVT